MTNWTFFSTLTAQLIGVIQAGGDALLNGALTYAHNAVLAASVAWIAFRAIMVATGKGTVGSLYRDLIRIAVVVFLLQSVATYNQYVGDLAFAIPTEVGKALAAVGANTGDVANGAAFDGVWNAAAKAGLAVFDHIPKYSLSSIPLWIAVIVYLAIALIAIGVSFLVYLASTILLLLLLKTGPLFVALFAFQVSLRFASGWVAAVVSTILTQILTVAILVLFVGVEANTVTHITTTVVAGGVAANFIDEIVTLAEAALVLWLIALLVKQAPSFAQGIAGGVYHNVSSVVGAPSAALRFVSRGGPPPPPGGGGGGGGGGPPNNNGGRGGKSAPPQRVTQPTGKSLSGNGGKNVP